MPSLRSRIEGSGSGVKPGEEGQRESDWLFAMVEACCMGGRPDKVSEKILRYYSLDYS